MIKFGSALPKRLREPQRFEHTDPHRNIPFSDNEPPISRAMVAAHILIVVVVVGAVIYLNWLGVK